jgi:hypothetical protein
METNKFVSFCPYCSQLKEQKLVHKLVEYIYFKVAQDQIEGIDSEDFVIECNRCQKFYVGQSTTGDYEGFYDRKVLYSKDNGVVINNK